MASKPRSTPQQDCEHCRREFSSRARWCPHCNLAVGEPIRMHEEVAYGVTFRNDDGVERQDVLHRLARRRARVGGQDGAGSHNIRCPLARVA